MPPKPAQLVLVHVVTDGRAVWQLFFAMNATANEEPFVALSLETDLVALHHLDVVGRQEARRAEARLVAAQDLLIDLRRDAFQRRRLIVDVGFVDADRLQ